ncbi:MAG: hypothetical protein EBS07_09795 [Sphingobacteriia bacterium]|nr:hypothetical protein [Sphingobacteriia bacterium]
MSNKSFYYLLVYYFLFSLVCAQNTQELYWVTFQECARDLRLEKKLSATTYQNRRNSGLPEWQASDYGPEVGYLSPIQEIGGEIRTVSRWLNAASVRLSESQVDQVNQLYGVESVTPLRSYLVPASREYSLPAGAMVKALEAMQAQTLIRYQLTGEGVKIGVIDAGFYQAHTTNGLVPLFENKQILGYRDFLTPGREGFFDLKRTEQDGHGTLVLLALGGKEPQTQFGLATGSEYYLAITDHPVSETRREEDLWIAAVEWMDSLGIRLINSSLAYGDGFDEKKENHKVSEIDGKTLKITQAADLAVNQKGILIVNAAGNSGDRSDWKIIEAPADAKGVLTVGSATPEFRKVAHSSIGPDKLPWVKPEIAAISAVGTSFAAPFITGLAACLWELEPGLSALQMKELIQRSGHLSPFPNNYLGYGIPQADRAIRLIEQPRQPGNFANTIKAEKKKVEIPVPDESLPITIYHKWNSTRVTRMETGKSVGGVLTVQRPETETHTTVNFGTQSVYEITWLE